MKLTFALCTIALLTTLAAADPRQWNPPMAVRQGMHIEWDQNTARDAGGNVLMVWADARRGDLDIYAQLLDPEGTPLWPAGGVPVVTAPDIQREPLAVAVDGGWIVVWKDARSAQGSDYYERWVRAQKLNGSGQRLWPDNDQTGVLVDDQTAAYDDYRIYRLHAVHDGSGGALIAWYHPASGSTCTVLSQRISSTGARGWVSSVAILNSTNYVTDLQSDGDGTGSMLYVWDQSGTNGTIVHLGKITMNGEMPWGAAGTVLGDSASASGYWAICKDRQGGGYVLWNAYLAPSVRALRVQRFNAEGQILWQPEGIMLSSSFEYGQTKMRIAPSSNGDVHDGLLVVWEDLRVNHYTREIYGQKISSEGAPIWTAGGLKICGNASGNQNDPQGYNRRNPSVVSDGVGGLIAAWDDYRTEESGYADLYAARVLADGSLPWTDQGNLVAGGRNQQQQSVLQANADFLVLYSDFRSESISLRAQQMNLSGQRLLPDSGIVLADGIDYSAYGASTVALSDGRAAVVWIDFRDGSMSNIYFQIVNTEGAIEKPVNGMLLVSSSQSYMSSVCICADGIGGFFTIYVTDAARLMAVHVNAAGDVDSNPAGELIPAPPNSIEQGRPMCASDGHGGAYIAWESYDSEYWQTNYVMRINSACRPVWAYPVQLNAREDNPILAALVAVADGSCIAGWTSGTWQTYDINAARILPQGFVVYNRVYCDAPGLQSQLELVADADGGARLVWVDDRANESEYGIYAQRLSPLGVEIWQHNGIAVVADSVSQENPAIAIDPQGNLFVLWYDYRQPGNGAIVAQKLSPAGSCLWPVPGITVCNTSNWEHDVSAVSDGGSGLFVVWTDNRRTSGYYTYSDTYGTHLQGNGLPVDDPFWRPNGSPLFDTTSLDQTHPVLLADDRGGFLIVANRNYSYNEDYYYSNLWAQRISNAAYAVEDHPAVALSFELAQNYPNPFNPSTTISFSLPQAGKTTLSVYNVLGEEVARLADRVMPSGQYRVPFHGGALSSGIYFYRLESPSGVLTKRMLLLK